MAIDHDTGVQITVVLCTYNRAERLGGAVRAILDQSGCEFELVVVDDGSTDETPGVLASYDDPRLRVIRRANGGLSAARNSGLAAARGAWVVFIDDDDLALPGWLAAFLAQTGDASVGIACCGARCVDSRGDELRILHPSPLGEPFGPMIGSSLAGTFAARTDLVRAAGGYLDGLGTRHQSELFIRLLAVARERGLRLSNVDEPRVQLEMRHPTDRPGVNPRRLYDGTRWILARHPDVFAGKRRVVGLFEAVAATNAARLGEWRGARRRFLRALRANPRSPEAWGRLALAGVPPAGHRVWNRHGSWSTHNSRELGLVHQPAATGSRAEPELFLAWRYRENPRAGGSRQQGGGSTASRVLSEPAHELARRITRRRRWARVLQATYDGDGDVVVAGDGHAPAAVVCHDALHRVDDPVRLLHRLAEVAGGAPLLLSTPDRARSDPGRPLGPPSDPVHRREWTVDQLELLLLSTGWELERMWYVRPPGSARLFGLRPSGRTTAVVLARKRSG
jgi:glycosyltransferase involved in cell wall biosynthesis